MFKPKKQYPPGTFVPTLTRTVAILQLCLAFSLLMWVLSEPFMNAYFSHRSNQLLFQASTNHQEFFTALPQDTQTRITDAYTTMEANADQPFSMKAKQAVMLLMVHLPSFQQAWLLFAIVIPVMVLKRREGAQIVAWILPLLAICYATDNRMHTVSLAASPDSALFPTEQYLVSHYLDSPLSRNISEQHVELTHAWQRYLVTEWAQQQPSNDSSKFALQLEKGEHAFHTERLLRLVNANAFAAQTSPQTKSALVLFTYVIWNLFFAAIVNRKRALW